RSRCFCGCLYERHTFRKGRTLPVCETCECQSFEFVPSRPEEIGEWWLPRRPGFDASSWRTKCRCGHSHEDHHPSRRSCGSCKCGEFLSAYGCVVCDSHQEDHQTQVETDQERASVGRPVGRDYVPLSQSPQLSQLTFGRKSRRSSADLASSGTENAAAVKAATYSSGGQWGGGPPSRKEERHLSSQPSAMECDSTRQGNRFHPQSTEFPAVGCGGAGTRKVIGSSRYITSPSLKSSGKTLQGSRFLSASKREGKQPQNLTGSPSSNWLTAEGCNYDGGVPINTIASASPELLYASGRITAARYHEILADMRNRRGPNRGRTVDPRVGISTHREARA
ncbi:unnamed protein product, partial [Hapterophycus canaliculatus]